MSARSYPLLENLDAVHSAPGDEASVFAVLRHRELRKTRTDQPFYDVAFGDQSAVLSGKLWSDASEAMTEIASLEPGTPVKVAFRIDSYQGQPQLRVQQIRRATDEDQGFDPKSLFGDVPDWLHSLTCKTLVFDIETVPAQDIRSMPQTIVKSLTEHAERRDMDQAAVMGLSPYFGKVVSLAFGEGERDAPSEADVTALVVPRPDDAVDRFEEWVRPLSEPELLRAFWFLAENAETVVTYNGRGFDVPFLVARSLLQDVPARVDLLSNRFSLRPHLDLFDVLGQRGRGPSNLDVICWALGIESPKTSMDGSMVAPAYESGRIDDIARYNRQDVVATAKVYRRTREHVLRFRRDWS